MTVNLLELQGDFRYIALFILALVPLVIATQADRGRRGWTLVWLGNLIMFLTMMLPAVAGAFLLEGAESAFPEGTRISNPRVFTSSAMAVGLLGGYVVLFGGLIDLRHEGTSRYMRMFASSAGLIAILLLLLSGGMDTYSILVEFYQRGATLGQRFVEHFVFVLVSLFAGLIIGIALGLWASRDERIEPVILYAVGIIQTIPSLALFGVLLVPLARLGDQPFMNVLQFVVLTFIVGAVLLLVFTRIQNSLPMQLRSGMLILSMFALAIPLSLFTISFITFGFEAILRVFRDEDLVPLLALAALGIAMIPLTIWLDRRIDSTRSIRYLKYLRYGGVIIAIGLMIYAVIQGAQGVLGSATLADLEVSDIGVSGIGTAPALIALTLYSLLPLVRNTYAGLNNIDPAIIDSGKGLGMTPVQIFFQIELPLAFPVIMAGVRNAGISLVGIAAVASIIGAGALGDFILLGVNTTSIDLILLGAIPAIVLAIMLDALLQAFEALFTSPGIRQTTQ